MSSSPALYDEQIGITFTESFTAMQYNVTAVEQQDPSSGYGPAYLLNGLTTAGYWYQVGLTWNWNPGYSPGTGFDMAYEVFNSNGQSIFPANGDGGLAAYSGVVNQGDTVVLNLYFSGGNVVMLSKDLNTSAEASVTYSAEGAAVFLGLVRTANSNGFFTGLMTEWYHPSPYYDNEEEVSYTDKTFGQTSAIMWMDEFNSQNDSQILFDTSSGLVVYSADPTQLQEFSSNGASEYSDAYQFVTGAMAQISLTLSYSVQGGGTGYSPPILTYVSGGVTKTATLGTSSSTYIVDQGSAWSVDTTLSGSGPSERWQTDQAASGTATTSLTTDFVYYNQYLQTLSYSVSDSSSPPAPTFTADSFGSPTGRVLSTSAEGYWFDGGASWSITGSIAGGQGERWELNSTQQTGSISSPQKITFVYEHQFELTFAVTPPGDGSISPTGSGLWEDSGTLQISATGNPNYVFSSWSSGTGSISFTNPQSANTTVTVAGAGTITAGFVFQPYVKEQVSITMSPAGSTAVTVTISGCGATIASIQADGNPDTFSAYSQCAITLTAPTKSNSLVWEFRSGSGAGSTTWTYTTTDNGTDVKTNTLYVLERETAAFSVSGGGSGYSAPTLSFEGLGKAQTYTMTTTKTEIDIDEGTPWSITNPLSGSGSSERWQAPGSSVSGASVGGATITPVFYNQFQPMVSFSVVDGGAGYSSPDFQCLQFGAAVAFNASATPTGEWVDAGCPYSFTDPLSGSTPTARWQSPGSSGTTSGAGALDPVYYHQFVQILSYSVIGSGTGGSPDAPYATGSQFGSAYFTPLSPTAKASWFDASGSISFTSDVAGSSDQRWASATVGVSATSASTTVVPYYNQYEVSFLYSIIGGGSPEAPSLTCNQTGGPAVLPLTESPQEIWCDSGSVATATDPTPGSSSSERWSDGGSQFAISGAENGSATFDYYHQFLVTLDYSVVGGGSPDTPSASGTAFGRAMTASVSSSPLWLDSDSTLNFPSLLATPSGGERWVTNASTPIMVGSAVNDPVEYQHQYYVNIDSANSDGGSVSPDSGWADAGSSLRVVSSPVQGWNLGSWAGDGMGSYSGSQATSLVMVQGPINETAIFYPGLDLSVDAGGSVTYSYGSTLGRASPGQEVLYVPPDTNVTLLARPSSVFYSFGGWVFGHSDAKPTSVIAVDSPTTTEAMFSYNLIVIGALAALAVVLIAMGIVYRARGHGRSDPSPTPIQYGN